MQNPLEYLSCNKSNWFIDIPMIIAQKSTKLWLGKGLLFNADREDILNYFNTKIITDKWFEKLYKFGIQNSLLGKVYIMPIINKDNSVSLKVLPNSFAGRVAKYNEEEQAAEFFFINEQADSATLTWVIAENGKIRFENYKSNNKSDKEIILGTAHTKLKPNMIPKYSYEIKNPWNYLPILEITNLPQVNFYGNSTTLNSYPDCYAVWDLITDLNHVIRQKRLERVLNVTKGFANIDNDSAKQLMESNSDIAEYAKDFFVNASTVTYDKNGQSAIQIIQGNPKFQEYWVDYNGTAKQIFNGSGYDYDEFGNKTYTNKTESLFNNKFDMETTETKIAFYSTYFYRLFDMILVYEKLWNGSGERPYSFKFIPISMTDQIQQNEIINSRLSNGTMSTEEAIGEYDNVNQLIAKSKLQAIIKETKKLNKELGDNENGSDEQLSMKTTSKSNTPSSKNSATKD